MNPCNRWHYLWKVPLVLAIWVLLFMAVHHAARATIRFIAFEVTGSVPEWIGCCKVVWDSKLQLAAYGLYAVIFASVWQSIVYWLNRYPRSAIVDKASMMLFIMVFPTHTWWGIASNCRGFGGCSVGYRLHILVPNILSINPIAIAASATVAYLLYRRFLRRRA